MQLRRKMTAWDLTLGILTDWKRFNILACLILLTECFLGAVIILRVPYTEIDWVAYMQEVEGWIEPGGTTDYKLLAGDTGPLVYPAGFLYIYAGLRWLVGDGGRGPVAVRLAQWIFLALYLVVQALVLRLYAESKPGPPWVAVILVASKRVHSLFVLRMFNDCFAMAFAYASILLFTQHKWLLGCAVYSCGVGIKMNVLLFAPALGILLLRNTGLVRTLLALVICFLVQVLLGLPFLATFPASYLGRAFELSRVFTHTWTVNWKFLPPALFTSKALAVGLLAAHLAVLLTFAHFIWLADKGGLLRFLAGVLWPRVSSAESSATGHASLRSTKAVRHAARPVAAPPSAVSASAAQDSPAFIVYTLFTCNFVGIVFARTLHYQFYSWYFHALPWLLWGATDLPLFLRLAVLGGIEYAFNVGDASGAATPLSSAVLQQSHWLLLAALLVAGLSRRAQ